MKSLSIVSVLACLAVMSGACGSQVASRPQADAFEVELRARNDDGAPLGGVTWTHSGQTLGEAATDGALRLTLRGREGQSMQTAVVCPAGYVAPDTGPQIRLTHTRRITDTRPQPVTVEAVCTRTARDIALVVHAEHGPALPVLIDGKDAGSTDADGNAHVLLRIDRAVRNLELAVDTSARADLTPRNPARSFELDGRDGVLVFAESFTATAAAKAKAQAHPKYVPYRVN